MTKTYAQWDADEASRIIQAHAHIEGALLPILHELQETFGYVHEDAIPLLANALNLSRAEVHGVVTFYHDYRRAPAGRHVLKLCRAEACQSMGAAALGEQALAKIKGTWGDTSANGQITVEAVYCLGMCACSPAALWDDKPVGRLDAKRLDAILSGEAA